MFSRNQIRATPVSPDQSGFKGKIIEETPFSAGGLESKKLLRVKIGSTATTFVERDKDQYYVDAWQALREAELPVAPTLHYSSRNSLLVGDVKVDGSEVYGKSFLQSFNRPTDEFRRSPEADVRFIELMENNENEVLQAAQHLAEVAARNAIRLPCDDPLELHVRPNGEWGLVLLDLTSTVVPANLVAGAKRFVNDPMKPANFGMQNQQYVQAWHFDLNGAYQVLKRQNR